MAQRADFRNSGLTLFRIMDGTLMCADEPKIKGRKKKEAEKKKKIVLGREPESITGRERMGGKNLIQRHGYHDGDGGQEDTTVFCLFFFFSFEKKKKRMKER